MSTVLIIARDTTLRESTARALIHRGLAPVTAASYDDAMAEIHGGLRPGTIVIRPYSSLTDDGSVTADFNHWLRRWMCGQPSPVPMLYLRDHGSNERQSSSAIPGPALRMPMHPALLAMAIAQQLDHGTVESDALHVDITARTVRLRDGAETGLTRVETHLLAWLQMGKGSALTHAALVEDVWCYRHPEGAGVLVRAHTSNLRRKLRLGLGVEAASTISTVKGFGYRYVAPAPAISEEAA